MQTQRKHAHFMQKDHKLIGAFEPRTFKLTARKSAFILCQTKLPVHVSNLHKSLNLLLFFLNSCPSHSLPSTHTLHITCIFRAYMLLYM